MVAEDTRKNNKITVTNLSSSQRTRAVNFRFPLWGETDKRDAKRGSQRMSQNHYPCNSRSNKIERERERISSFVNIVSFISNFFSAFFFCPVRHSTSRNTNQWQSYINFQLGGRCLSRHNRIVIAFNGNFLKYKNQIAYSPSYLLKSNYVLISFSPFSPSAPSLKKLVVFPFPQQFPNSFVRSFSSPLPVQRTIIFLSKLRWVESPSANATLSSAFSLFLAFSLD